MCEPYLARHSLFHVMQYNHIDFDAVLNVRKLLAWMEATAEWGAHQAPRDDSNVDAAARQRYASELKRFLQDPGGQLLKGTITDRRPYGAFIFASFPEERLGVEAIRRTWERTDNTWFPEADVQITGTVQQDAGTTAIRMWEPGAASWPAREVTPPSQPPAPSTRPSFCLPTAGRPGRP
ncbi:hypothetical protein [Streptomyces sp. UG1]|uniref:hypothetical protein n=1 Tax=Streptomyces sp. UG1 TaxID=3417652 RepID=UPI003CFA526B